MPGGLGEATVSTYDHPACEQCGGTVVIRRGVEACPRCDIPARRRDDDRGDRA